MGPVKHPDLVKEHHGEAAFSLRDAGTKSAQQGFDVFPGDVGAGRVLEDQCQSAFVAALYVSPMVLKIGTL